MKYLIKDLEAAVRAVVAGGEVHGGFAGRHDYACECTAGFGTMTDRKNAMYEQLWGIARAKKVVPI